MCKPAFHILYISCCNCKQRRASVFEFTSTFTNWASRNILYLCATCRDYPFVSQQAVPLIRLLTCMRPDKARQAATYVCDNRYVVYMISFPMKHLHVLGSTEAFVQHVAYLAITCVGASACCRHVKHLIKYCSMCRVPILGNPQLAFMYSCYLKMQCMACRQAILHVSQTLLSRQVHNQTRNPLLYV